MQRTAGGPRVLVRLVNDTAGLTFVHGMNQTKASHRFDCWDANSWFEWFLSNVEAGDGQEHPNNPSGSKVSSHCVSEITRDTYSPRC